MGMFGYIFMGTHIVAKTYHIGALQLSCTASESTGALSGVCHRLCSQYAAIRTVEGSVALCQPEMSQALPSDMEV